MDLVAGASNNAVKSLVGKLGSLLAQEYTLISGVRDDIQYINDELASMQAFLNRLKRAPGPSGHDEQQQDWMKQVREVSYDIEDCVDNVGHRLGGEPRGSGTLMYLRRAWYLLTSLHARHCIATEIRNLKVRAQHVSDRRTRYGVENPSGSTDAFAGADPPRDRPTPPPQLIGTRATVGMEEAIKELEEWFPEENQSASHHQLQFLAIVGFGGLGKTTLALTLYREFGDRFTCRAYVLASQKFHLPTVMKSLVKQLHEQQFNASKNDLDGLEEWGEEALKKKLADQLQGKRFFILIDDIWSVSAWENIRDSFPKNEKGGSIVLTTRFKSVAEACRRQQGRVYEHKLLLKEQSCELFYQVIYGIGYNLSPSRPSKSSSGIIMDISGGLPLSIIVVAGLVASKLKRGTDLEVDHHLIEVGKELSEKLGNNITTEGVSHILDYCYDHLPAELKTCLLYLSMFPKGCLISRKRLIRRWMAEGFITEKHGKTVEEVAEDCLSDLISRNLIRVVNNSSNGKVKSCQVHDMVLEYIVAKSSDENFITVVGGHWHTPFPSYKVRRLSIHKSDHQEKEMVERMKLSHVRSLTALESFRALHSTMHKLQILQVLDLEGCKDISLNQLKKICSLHQLKYLSLRRTDIDKIPNNISKLEYLELFDIRDTNIRELPASVERLQRMIHLLAGNKSQRGALKLTEGITKMTALQTLSGVEIYGSSSGAAKGRSIDRKATGAQVAKSSLLNKEQHSFADLENLTNLKKFTIYRLVCFTDSDNVLLLSAIEHLSSCNLKFFSIDDDFCGFLDSSLNASQAPPEHLHTLGLSGELSQVPDWIDRLHYLEKLTLSLTSLKTSTLQVLTELPELFSLIFTLDSSINKISALQILQKNILESGGSVFVPEVGFKKLKLLRFITPVLPPLSFLKGSMPELQRLELRFVMTEGVYGLENLERLQQVVLTVSSQAPADAKLKAYQIKALASMIPNGPSVAVDEYNESS